MPLKIRIQQHDFTFPERYSEGHVCTAGEAAALNQVFAENIRNNVFNWVGRTMQEHGTSVLSPEAHSDLQGKIEDYAGQYQFRVRNRARPPTALESAIDEIAISQAEVEGQQAGYPLDSPEVQLRFLQLRSDPGTVSKARALLESRRLVATDTLKDLLNDV